MRRVSQQTIEQIAAANDIVEVVSGYFPLKRAGAVFKALCPFHQEKTPSFTVNPQRQIFKCFGCGAGGTVFKFVQLYENVDFPTALRRLADRAGIALVEEQLSPADDRRLRLRQRLLALHQEAADWLHRNLVKEPFAQAARDYLKSRGFSLATARAWNLGYAPDSFEAFTAFARGRGFSDEEIVRSGMVKLRNGADAEIARPDAPLRNVQFYDRFRHRLMFPICNDLGEVIAFSGRVLDAESREAKYINSPETMLFTKGNVLFGLHKSRRALIDKKSAVVLEGQIDLISAFEAGVQNVIAPQGTAFTENQARILKRYVEEVVLCFDADPAGQKAVERSLPALLDVGLFVRVAVLPPGCDPDTLIRTRGAAAFRQRIEEARDFFERHIEDAAQSPELATSRGKLEWAQKLAGFISLIPDPLWRETVIHQAGARLHIPASDLRRFLKTTPHSPSPKETAAAVPSAVAELDNTMSLLCHCALTDQAARDWLLEQDWPEVLQREPDGALLGRILGADLQIDLPASVNAFLASLPAAEEAALSRLLLQWPAGHGETVARECWMELQRRALRRRIETATARLRLPNLPEAEMFDLQKKVLDLQKMLMQISRPFS